MKFTIGQLVLLKSKNGDSSQYADDLEIGMKYSILELTPNLNSARLTEGSNSWVNVEDIELFVYEPSYSLKTPLGVIPKKYHRMKRIQELARAIKEFVDYDIEGNLDYLDKWSEELNWLVYESKSELTPADEYMGQK